MFLHLRKSIVCKFCLRVIPPGLLSPLSPCWINCYLGSLFSHPGTSLHHHPWNFLYFSSILDLLFADFVPSFLFDLLQVASWESPHQRKNFKTYILKMSIFDLYLLSYFTGYSFSSSVKKSEVIWFLIDPIPIISTLISSQGYSLTPLTGERGCRLRAWSQQKVIVAQTSVTQDEGRRPGVVLPGRASLSRWPAGHDPSCSYGQCARAAAIQITNPHQRDWRWISVT